MKRLLGPALLSALMCAAQPALSESPRSVALVLDASGSMNAKLPDGQTRIDAAKKAVADLVSRMDTTTRLALRAYGHQSPTAEEGLQGHRAAGRLRAGRFEPGRGRRQAQALQARGYTPITYALTAAAQDMACGRKRRAHRRARQRRAGDLRQRPVRRGAGAGRGRCEARHPHDRLRRRRRRAHAAAVHRQCRARQLFRRQQCGGSVVDARQGGGHQGRSAGQTTTSTTVRVAKQTPSRIVIKNTWAGVSHPVTRAEDGQQVADINGAVGHADVPPGLYNVSFPNGVWRGVEVKPGETTELEVGLLKIEGGPSDIKGYVITRSRDRRGRHAPRRDHLAAADAGPLQHHALARSAGRASRSPPASTTVLNPARIVISGNTPASIASRPATAARPEKSQYCSACRSRRAATSSTSKGRR